jgi:radical SAM protein with 4Fe4S-binding SPASM domain
MDLLKTGSFEGNEAGAEQYLGFAPTEIEEALRRMEWGEHFEYLKYRHHWHKYPHLLRVREFPVHLGIESSSVCDLRCKMCFQSDTEFKRQKSNFGFMDYELYKRIIDESAERGLCSVKLSIRGEPILNPMLPQMIAYAREKKLLDVMFDTNANQLDEDKSRAILQAEPHLIIFSVDADTKEIFESIRTGAVFERVLNNITRFLEIKEKESPHAITKTRVQMTVIPEARHEIDAVRQRWKGLVDQIAIKEALIRQHTNDTVRENQRPCRVLWQRLDIHYDGSVWLCDNDCYGKYCVGHVLKESIYEIWHGTKMTRMRELHAERYKHKIEPCKHCDGL